MNFQDSSTEKSTIFLIAPFGAVHADSLRVLLKEIAEEMGYIFERIDDRKEPGSIEQDIIKAILTYKLVIADISGGNPNVLYELGLRYATNKPVILVADPTTIEKLPFDINTHRVHMFQKLQDPNGNFTEFNNKEKFKDTIKAAITATEKNPENGFNPVLKALEYKFYPLRKEGENIEILVKNLIIKLLNVLDLFKPSVYHNLSIKDQAKRPFRKGAKELVKAALDSFIQITKNNSILSKGKTTEKVFKLFFKALTDKFEAVSVDDLDFWRSKDGESYLILNKSVIEERKKEVFRVFVFSKQKVFHKDEKDVINKQIDAGIKVAFAYQEDIPHAYGTKDQLDFALFDDFATSKFIYNTLQREHFISMQLEDIEYARDKWRNILKNSSYQKDNKWFTNKDEAKKWFSEHNDYNQA